MMKLFTALSLIVAMLSIQPLRAQTVELEKTYEITGKSKRGSLANVEYNREKGLYTLYYVTKANDRMARFEIYTFDKDFNFVNLTTDEIEFEKVKAKYTWFKYRGELYTVDGLFVEPTMMGTLVLKRKKITYSYDWLFLGYRKKVEVLEKLKPKSDDGSKFHYHTHFEDDREGVVYVLAGEKEKVSKDADPNKPFAALHLLKYNKELDLLGDVKLNFDYPQSVVIARSLPFVYEDDPENPSFKGMTFVFAPMSLKGLKEDPNKSNFTWVRISNDMKLDARVSFESPSPGWKIDELIYDEARDEMYYYGPSAEGRDKYWATAINTNKYKAVQLMKISSNKVEYLTSTNLDEFEAKLKTPPSQKKSPAYAGKKFRIANYYMASNGDFFVIGQNFQPNDKTGPQFKDVLCFHFDSKGVLKAQYGVDTKEANAVAQANGCPQFFIEGASGKSMYWFLREIDGFAPNGRLLTYLRIGKIDMNGATITDLKMPGGDKKPEYFLDPNFPFLETEKGGVVTLFGADKKGKTIWFCRVKLD
jgi:hypothetical protein